MKKNWLLILAFSITLISCKKTTDQSTCVSNNTGVPTAAEVASVQAYLTSKGITATQDPGGFFYTIVAAGSGATPTLSSKVTVKYVGSLESGTIFDQRPSAAFPSPATFSLSQLILGWQKGLPLIKKGGSIKLYLPPSLGYGCGANGSIPPGSNLIFTVDLLDVL